MKVAVVWPLPGPVLAPPSLALGLLGPVLHESVPTPRGCEGSRRPPHPPAHSRGHMTALPPLKRGNKISAVQKTLAFFCGTWESNQMSNTVTTHSVKQRCGRHRGARRCTAAHGPHVFTSPKGGSTA